MIKKKKSCSIAIHKWQIWLTPATKEGWTKLHIVHSHMLGWPKISFWFFYQLLHKNLNKVSDQHYRIMLAIQRMALINGVLKTTLSTKAELASEAGTLALFQGLNITGLLCGSLHQSESEINNKWFTLHPEIEWFWDFTFQIIRKGRVPLLYIFLAISGDIYVHKSILFYLLVERELRGHLSASLQDSLTLHPISHSYPSCLESFVSTAVNLSFSGMIVRW